MADDFSFDVVSKVDPQSIDDAINAAKTRKVQEPSTATDVAARLDPEREIGDTERSTALARPDRA